MMSFVHNRCMISNVMFGKRHLDSENSPHFFISDPATDCPAAVLPVQDDEKKAEKLKQTKGNMYRAAKPKDHEGRRHSACFKSAGCCLVVCNIFSSD